MEKYLVGGAVRDGLLGLPVRERDWVVVGATPEMMRTQGYRQVGHAFPVFLHPITGEEYALARTERKTGPGHGGFICYFTPYTTLEEDLRRRDLTINAMAQSEEGTLFDYYGGANDLKHRWLRHISPAFREDPLRVLRVARFAACYAILGFRIAPETYELMYAMSIQGELRYLTAERIWLESSKALSCQNPQRYFAILHRCCALTTLFPELNQLFNVPGAVKHHSAMNYGVQTLLALKRIARISKDIAVRFAVLCCYFGMGENDQKGESIHQGDLPIRVINDFCARLKVPNRSWKLALLVAQVREKVYRVTTLSPEALLHLFNQIDVWRRPQRLSMILLACQAGQLEHPLRDGLSYLPADYLLQAWKAVASLQTSTFIKAGFTGLALAKKLREQRIEILHHHQQQWQRS